MAWPQGFYTPNPFLSRNRLVPGEAEWLWFTFQDHKICTNSEYTLIHINVSGWSSCIADWEVQIKVISVAKEMKWVEAQLKEAQLRSSSDSLVNEKMKLIYDRRIPITGNEISDRRQLTFILEFHLDILHAAKPQVVCGAISRLSHPKANSRMHISFEWSIVCGSAEVWQD